MHGSGSMPVPAPTLPQARVYRDARAKGSMIRVRPIGGRAGFRNRTMHDESENGWYLHRVESCRKAGRKYLISIQPNLEVYTPIQSQLYPPCLATGGLSREVTQESRLWSTITLALPR